MADSYIKRCLSLVITIDAPLQKPGTTPKAAWNTLSDVTHVHHAQLCHRIHCTCTYMSMYREASDTNYQYRILEYIILKIDYLV